MMKIATSGYFATMTMAMMQMQAARYVIVVSYRILMSPVSVSN
jgi:hypothetical protein